MTEFDYARMEAKFFERGCPPNNARGHEIDYDFSTDSWHYVADKAPVQGTPERSCTLCERTAADRGPDPCLGMIEGVKAACCGHGEVFYAYVLYEDGRDVRYEDALDLFAMLGVGPLSAGVQA